MSRTDEYHVRDVVGDGLFENAPGFTLLEQGTFVAGAEDVYASVRVICTQNSAEALCSVHTAVVVDEPGGPTVVRLINGTYGLTREQAQAMLL